jgi:hypothetical protein
MQQIAAGLCEYLLAMLRMPEEFGLVFLPYQEIAGIDKELLAGFGILGEDDTGIGQQHFHFVVYLDADEIMFAAGHFEGIAETGIQEIAQQECDALLPG